MHLPVSPRASMRARMTGITLPAPASDMTIGVVVDVGDVVDDELRHARRPFGRRALGVERRRVEQAAGRAEEVDRAGRGRAGPRGSRRTRRARPRSPRPRRRWPNCAAPARSPTRSYCDVRLDRAVPVGTECRMPPPEAGRSRAARERHGRAVRARARAAPRQPVGRDALGMLGTGQPAVDERNARDAVGVPLGEAHRATNAPIECPTTTTRSTPSASSTAREVVGVRRTSPYGPGRPLLRPRPRRSGAITRASGSARRRGPRSGGSP